MTVIQTFQPFPSIAHVELLFADERGDPHFATYCGKKAGWGFSFGNSAKFYTETNAGLWRAVPICAKGIAARLRHELTMHVGTPYSMARYVCSAPPLRALSGLLSDNPGAPAHCATLTARCLQRTLKSFSSSIEKTSTQLKHSSAWYGPTTLLIELTARSRLLAAKETASEVASEVASETASETASDVSSLLHGMSETVLKMPSAVKQGAILFLAQKACLSSSTSNAVELKIAQKQLATALLRSVYG